MACATQDTPRELLSAPVSGSGLLTLLLTDDLGVRAVPLPPTGAVTLGRASQSDVRIEDHEVSRNHLRIEITPELVATDLGSANGTYLRGERLAVGERRALNLGDSLKLGSTVVVVVQRRRARAPVRSQAPQLERVDVKLGEEMCAVLARAERVARSDLPVLILGETGVGKDVLAERIHRSSRRARGPFLRLNCAAFSPSLLESELFGHHKGAFTGAINAKQGLLQSADGGTVLLDEIAELPPEMQAKLLLVVERLEVLALGAERARRINVRFIAATHRDLHSRVKDGLFREDFFHRLNGLSLSVPPLRRRRGEIAQLACTFIASAAQSVGRRAPVLRDDALALLEAHSWPGNVRELRTVMERLVVLSERDELCAADLHECLDGFDDFAAPLASPALSHGPEHARIAAALASCAGNQSRAARMLGMSRNTLIARLAKYNMPRPLA